MIGRRVSHFRILERIGEGGMGVVYRAEDEKLQRVVALKVLPPERLADEERRLRFVREARAAAAITHPNIAVVHEIDESEGVVFIAMELVEGGTLRAAMGGKPMPLREALRLGVEIAEGLAAAHQARVIHRDLKPDNILVAKDGRVKLLDFGLAKLLEERPAPGSEEASQLETISDEMTQAGRVLGTASYMSPEQARGLPVDARSDLFSFGVVLYEMVTGRAPFRGSTSMDVMTAILHKEPAPPSQVNAEALAELERIIGKCLEKEPGDRYQDGRDLVVDLRRLKRDAESRPLRRAEPSGPDGATGGRPARRPWLAWTAGAAVVIGAAGVAAWNLLPRQEPKKELIQRQITANPDNPVTSAEISPDGRYIAYLDRSGVHVLQIDTGEAHPLRLPDGFGPEGVGWKSDGTAVLFAGRESKNQPLALWSVSMLGGAPRKLHDGLALPSPDGRWFVEPAEEGGRQVVRLLSATGEAPRTILTGAEGEILFPGAWSAASRRVAYVQMRMVPPAPGSPASISVKSCDLDGGNVEEIVSDPRLMGTWGFAGLSWLRDGRFIYGLLEDPPNERDSNLWVVYVDTATGRRRGDPRRVTDWTGAATTNPSVTDDGRRLAVLRRRMQSDVYLADLEAGGSILRNPRRFTLNDLDDIHPTWTRDGKAVVFASSRGGSWDLFKQDLEAANPDPVVVGPEQALSPVISPEADTIVYRAYEGALQAGALEGDASVMRIPLAGGTPRLVMTAMKVDAIDCPRTRGLPCVLGESRQGQIVFHTFDQVEGRGREIASVDLGAPFATWSLSDDGATIALIRAAENTNQVALIAVADGGRRDLAVELAAYLQHIDWAPSGDAVVVSGQLPNQRWALLRANLEGKSHVLLEGEGVVWMGRPAVSPDGRRLAYGAMTTEANVWLLENF